MTKAFDPEKFDKPDEANPTKGDGWFLSFPKNERIREYYVIPYRLWFTYPPGDIVADMGFDVEPGKLKNLISFGDGELDLWRYLNLLPEEYRDTLIADEWINFILGPLAAAVKVQGMGFEGRFKIIDVSGLLIMFEAMALDLVPSGKRKNLYEALFARFNVEFYAALATLEEVEGSENTARAIFYGILADIIEPIFSEAGAGELTAMIVKVLADNPKQAAQAKEDPKIVGWVMGQVMRASPTKLDPNTVRAAIIEALNS